MDKNFINKLINERVGLIMIGATLITILVIVKITTLSDFDDRMQRIQKNGTSLARLITKVPLEQLIHNGSDNVLKLLTHNKNTGDLSYTVLVSLTGKPLASVVADNAIIPTVPVTQTPSLWITEHLVERAPFSYMEYQAPIFSNNELAGYARMGYLKPKADVQLSDLSQYAKMALPIFLLVPIFYLLFRREMQPLKQASKEIKSFMNDQQMKLELAGDNNDIVSNLHQFVTNVGQRMDEITNKQAQAQESTLMLGYKNKRIEAVLQSVPDAIVVLDEQGMVSYANSQLEALTGVSPESIRGNGLGDLATDPAVRTLLSKYNMDIKLRRSETVLFTPEQRPSCVIALTASPLYTSADKDTAMGTLLVFQNKTQESSAAKAQDEFLNHVSHEMKSPLNVIQMYTETLLDDLDADKSTRIESLNIVVDEVERMALLISNLLSISKIESGGVTLNKQRVILADFIQDVFDTSARLGKENQLNFDINMPKTLGAVNIDKELMRIALSNLLSNAIKYNEANGHVTLQVDDNNDNYEITVTDDGMGISADDLPHVFEKFYRADSETIRQRSGHGLGLSLSKNIVQLHHGKIMVSSVVGEGTVFSLTLYKQAVFHNEVVNK